MTLNGCSKEGKVNTANWNWEPGEKLVHDFGTCDAEYKWIEEPQASPDGEKIAAVVNIDEEEFTLCVNGTVWETTFERCWFPRYSPDGRLTSLVTYEGTPTLAVDGETWEESYDYLWQTMFSQDGSTIAAAVQTGMTYGPRVTDPPRETPVDNANHLTPSPGGPTSAPVAHVKPQARADTPTSQDGIYSAAADGKAWDTTFVDAWQLVFNKDCSSLAAEVRTSLFDYTIAVDGVTWKETFPCVWAPVFNPSTGSVVAPVRIAGKWTVAENGQPIWDQPFIQCWHAMFSPDGQKLAAIVSPTFGRWTLAVDGKPWSTTFGDLVTEAGFSPDGSRLAALGKQDEKWAVFADDKPWSGRYDMAYTPVFSPDSRHVAAKVEKNGRFTVVVNDKEYTKSFNAVWDPIFSPDSKNILIRCLEDGKYTRRVVPVNTITG